MNRLKKIISSICITGLLIGNITYAMDENSLNKADALNYLGLLQGTGSGFELEKSLTRAEAITMIVRFLGAEEQAIEKKYTCPFIDVPDWAINYVGYAYEKGITKGTSDTEFSPNEAIGMNQYLTFLLRVLGYSDTEGDFQWDIPFEIAGKVGLLTKPIDSSEFVRGDMVDISWNALSSNYKTGSMNVSEYLIGNKLFTSAGYKTAQSIAKNGKEAALKENPNKTGTVSFGGGSNKNNSTVQNDSVNNNKTEEEKYEGVTYKVTFYDENRNVINEQVLKAGESAVPPENPQKPGYVFLGWSHSFEDITGDVQTGVRFVPEDIDNLFYMNSVNAKAGDEFTVNLDLKGTVKIASFDMRLNYDTEVLELLDYAENPLMDVMAHNFDDKGELRFNVVRTQNITSSTNILSLTFKIKDDTTNKSSVITLVPNEFVYVDENSNDVNDCYCSTADCVVHIE